MPGLETRVPRLLELTDEDVGHLSAIIKHFWCWLHYQYHWAELILIQASWVNQLTLFKFIHSPFNPPQVSFTALSKLYRIIFKRKDEQNLICSCKKPPQPIPLQYHPPIPISVLPSLHLPISVSSPSHLPIFLSPPLSRLIFKRTVGEISFSADWTSPSEAFH